MRKPISKVSNDVRLQHAFSEQHRSASPSLSIKTWDIRTIELLYHKVPKYWDARKLCCNLPKIQTKRPNHSLICQKDANGIAKQ